MFKPFKSLAEEDSEAENEPQKGAEGYDSVGARFIAPGLRFGWINRRGRKERKERNWKISRKDAKAQRVNVVISNEERNPS